MQVTFLGDPIEVKGQPVQVGDSAPDAKVKDIQGQEQSLADLLKGKVTVLSVVPDVTTQTCHLQTKKFAELAAERDWNFYTISRNLPSEFKQWNEDNHLNVQTLSDELGEFGDQYGLVINLGGKELLTRSVFVVDAQGVVQYRQIVEEVSEQPDYDPVIETVNRLQ